MGFRKSFFIALFSCSIFVAAHVSSTIIAPLRYTETQAKTVVDVIDKLHSRHYRNQRVNDDLSERFLDHYLETLDPARMFFYEQDIKSFRSDTLKYDDYFKHGNLRPGFDIYHTYRQRVISRLESVIEIVSDTTIKFDFTKNDELVLDRKTMSWPASQQDADDLWFKRIKLSLLNLKLAGKPVEEGRKTLERRYKNQLNRVKQQDSADIFETLVNSLTELYDPHTNYWSPRTSENFNINMSLKLEGIGAVLQSEDEFTKVVRLVAGGPAAKQGQLKPADKIIGVAQGDNGEVIDVVGWRLDEVVKLIRGPKNTIVKLDVLPSGSAVGAESKIIRINRDEVKLEDKAAQKAILELSEGGRIYKLGIIDLPTFYIDFDAYNARDPNFRSSHRDVSRLLNELKKENVDGVVLDLRNNGGGSLLEATRLTDLFIDKGPVVQIRSPDGRINRHHRSLSKASYRGPLIVLVNRLSASASEIFAGAIQDYSRGLIIGSQSFGKGTVQSVTPLLEGRLKITESKFYRVSGDSTQHRGVIPDIELPLLIDKEEVGESTYDNALPWDKIHSVPHAKYYDLASQVPMLTKLHKRRTSKDPDFTYILDQINMMAQNKHRKTISLNEKTRIKEKEQLELQAMDIDNKRRKAKNMPLYKNLEEFRKADSEEEDTEEQKSEVTNNNTIDVDGDTILVETGNILVDFIRMQDKNKAQASNF